MKKIILSIFLNLLLINFLFFVFPINISGQDRYATCDRCGFCPPASPPSNWAQCVSCLYPDINPNPEAKETLKVNPETNLPPTPYPGRIYTMIGCVKTDLGSFQSEGAAASVVQVLLDFLFKIIGGVALIYLIYGSAIIMTSQANPERLNYGKRIVLGAIVGVIFSFSAVFLVNLLANNILRIPGFGQ